MTILRYAPMACFGLITLVEFFFAAVFLTSPTLMPYHLEAIGVAWAALPAGAQVMMLSFMRAVGAGHLAVAIALLFLLVFPLRSGATWAPYAIVSVYLAFVVPTSYVMTLLIRTGVRWTSTPLIPALLSILIVLVGLVAAVVGRPVSTPAPRVAME